MNLREQIASLRHLRRGSWFDLAVFAANCWFVPRLTALSEEGGETSLYYAVILLFSLGLYVLGAGLKRAPLQERLARTERPPVRMWAWIALFVLMIMQFALAIICFTMPLDALAAHVPNLPFSTGDAWVMIPTLTIAATTVCMTIRALVPPRAGPSTRPAKALRRQEVFADQALYFSALVMLSIWDGMFMASLSGRGPYPWYLAALLITLITVPFAMFYAAPRILFLVEDYRRPTTWLRIAAVMLPLSVRLLEAH